MSSEEDLDALAQVRVTPTSLFQVSRARDGVGDLNGSREDVALVHDELQVPKMSAL
jgi:hypothetical protein